MMKLSCPPSYPLAGNEFLATSILFVQRRGFRQLHCEVVTGDPLPPLVSTSYVERQNLTMRMGMRRFTRLTNDFSKKLENHMHAIALHYMYYNFCRINQTLRCTPAMEAGISKRVWEIDDIVALLD